MLYGNKRFMNACIQLLLTRHKALPEYVHCLLKIGVNNHFFRKRSEVGDNRLDHVRFKILFDRNRIE